MMSRPFRGERPISHGPQHPSMQVTHIPEMGATWVLVVVSVAGLELGLLRVIGAPPFTEGPSLSGVRQPRRRTTCLDNRHRPRSANGGRLPSAGSAAILQGCSKKHNRSEEENQPLSVAFGKG